MRINPLFIPLLSVSVVSAAQTDESLIDKSTETRICEVSMCAAPPKIDGIIEEGEWDQATLIDDLYQVKPNEYEPASEKTEFFVTFDQDNLYVAAKLYESDPSQITARISRQGANNGPDDGIRVFIDPYNSKRAGYMFGLNLNEVRTEGIFLNTTEFQNNWQGIWEGKTALTDYGWSTEVAIPFKTLTFDENNDTWGFNVYRYIARNDEMSGWVSLNRSNNASVSGELVGLSGMNQGMGLDIVPSFSTVNTRTYGPQDDDFNMEPSLDLFYKITPSLNGSLTINTDFSATEVDDQQVGLSQFNLFFPEKRDFFLREFDIFDFGGIGGAFNESQITGPEKENARPFFSRNIGLSSTGAPVDLIAGAKVSGKLGGYDVGMLVVEQDEFEDVDSTTIVVGRVAADVLSESSVGAIFTYGDPQSNLDNSVAGVDFRYRNSRLGAGKRIDANMWYQKSDTDGLEGNDSAFGAMFSMPNSQGWRGLAQYQRVEENFNPELGFVSRRDAELKRGVAGYTWRYPGHSWLRSIYSGVDMRQWDFLDGRVLSGQKSLRPLSITTNTDDSLSFSFHRFSEGIYSDRQQPFDDIDIFLPEGELNWDRYGLVAESSKSRAVDLRLVYFRGEYYTGERVSRTVEAGWRATDKFQVSATYEHWDVTLPEGNFKLRQVNARTEWAFSSTLSWVNVIQYNNINANLGINSRLHWTPKAGQNVYFVINHQFNELEDDNFVSESNEITLKASYTFRF